jgi:hypothetical protein
MAAPQTLVISDSEAEFLYAAAGEHEKRFTIRCAVPVSSSSKESSMEVHRIGLRKGIVDGIRSFPPQIGRQIVGQSPTALFGVPTSFDVWGVCQMVLRVDSSLARGKMARAILDRIGNTYDTWRIEVGN